MANLTLISDDGEESMAAAVDLDQYGVVIGNMRDGFTFLGPFPTYVAAKHWGSKLYGNEPEGVAGISDTWWVITLQEPNSYLG